MNTTAATPYEALGGEAGIKRLVHRFYELMDELPEAYGVRQMHPASLEGSGQSLFEFLSGWFGGPQLYMEKKATRVCGCATHRMRSVRSCVMNGCIA